MKDDVFCSKASSDSSLAADIRSLLGKLRRRLREQAGVRDLSNTQISVIGRLYRDGPATVTSLAQAEGMRPQSMGANIAALQSAGLVNGTPHPSDGRQTLLSITEVGRGHVDASRAAREDWLSRTIQAQLTPDEQATLMRAVALLKRIADS